MALITYVARRLGGTAVMQRTQARAVVVEQRLFLSRLIQTDEHAKPDASWHDYKAYSVSEMHHAKPAANRHDYKAYPVGEIQNAKPAANWHDYKAYPVGEIQHPKPAANRHDYKAYPVDEVQQKKEELYDIISKAEKEFKSIRQNRLLLQYLSVQIKPRPNDPEWRRLQATKRAAYWIGLAGIMSFVVTSYLFGWGN